jgi:hypothetical protein
MAVRTSKAMDDIADAADKIGVTTEALVGLRHQAALTGTSAEMLERGITKMMQNIGGGTSNNALEALGLNRESLIGMSAEQQFAAIAEAMTKIGTRSEQIALTTAIFGKNSAELVTMLDGGASVVAKYAEDAKELGIAFDSIDAARVEAVADEWYRAGQALQGFKQTLTVQLAPAVGAIAELFTTFFVESRKNLGSTTDEWYGLASAIGIAASAAQQLLILQLELKAIGDRAAAANARFFGVQQSAVNVLQKEYGDTLRRLRELSADDWGERVRDKWKEIANATGDANNALGNLVEDAEALAERMKPATDAAELFSKWFKEAQQFNMTDRMKQISDAIAAGAPQGLVDALRTADAALTVLEQHAEQVKFGESLNEQFQDPFDKFIRQAEQIDKADRAMKEAEKKRLMATGLDAPHAARQAELAGLAPGVREKAIQSAFEDFAGAPKDFRFSGAMEKGSAEAYSTILNAGKESDKTAKAHLQIGKLTLDEIKAINRKTSATSTVSIPSG